MERKPILSIALLVSNRWETIQKCLDSLTPIREAIPSELIILDTGCDKDLHDLLVSYADKIECFQWCRDFAKARNVTVDMAEGEWYLYLDDDEWFTETEELVDFFRSGRYKDYGQASYIQRNYLDFEGQQYTDCWVGRMIKLEPETRFLSKIHEYFEPRKGNSAPLKAVVEHYGYVYKTEEDKLKHFDRNYTLLKEMEAAEPKKIRWKLQILQELRSVDRYEEMISGGKVYMKQLEEHYALLPGEDHWDNQALGVYYASIMLGYEGQKEYAKAISWNEKLRMEKRTNELSKAFGELVAAHCYFYAQEYENCIAACQKYLQWDAFLAQNEVKRMEDEHLPIVSTTFDSIKFKEIYSLMICSGLKLGDAGYLGQYMHKIGWKDSNSYMFEETADVLLEAMLTLGYRKEFHRALRVIKNHKGLSPYFQEKIQGLKEAGVDLTAIENMGKFGIRGFTKKHILEILDALSSVSAVMKTLWKAGNVQELEGILGEAQKVAISLGTAIEEELGVGTKAVEILEEYCEILWSIHEENTGISQEQNGEIYLKNLSDLLELERTELLAFPVKEVVVFLPCKKDNWKCMEKLWREAVADDCTDEYVMPIPYFTKNEDGSFQQAFYEGNAFPQEVFMVDWQIVDLSALRPDRIYVENDYDDKDENYSVHPDYYVERLKSLTEEIQVLGE